MKRCEICRTESRVQERGDVGRSEKKRMNWNNGNGEERGGNRDGGKGTTSNNE